MPLPTVAPWLAAPPPVAQPLAVVPPCTGGEMLTAGVLTYPPPPLRSRTLARPPVGSSSARTTAGVCPASGGVTRTWGGVEPV